MEEMVMMKKQYPHHTTTTATTTTPSSLSIHKDSQIISKVKPKIRIIHIFAPEIIKTDVANFRELVQRLTGKPSPSDLNQKGTKNKIKKPGIVPSRIVQQDHHHQRAGPAVMAAKKLEIRSTGFIGNNDNNNISLGFKEKVMVKQEEEAMWNGANSGGYLAGFADLDGFIQELGEFPMLPMETHHMHAFGESQLA